MCELDTGDYCQVWTESHRKARKPHRCDCCRGETIKPGDTYLVHFNIYEGCITSEKMCAGCEADREVFAKEHGNRHPVPSSVTDYLSECIDEDEDRIYDEVTEEYGPSRWDAVLERISARRKSEAA